MSQNDNPKSDTPSSSDQNLLYWKYAIVAAAIFIGWAIGEFIGKTVGAEFDGFGHISGERVGEWIGFAVGVSIGAVVFGNFLTVSHGTKNRPIITNVAFPIVILLSVIVAIVGEGYFGELGGPLAFCLFWGLLIAVVLVIARRSSSS